MSESSAPPPAASAVDDPMDHDFIVPAPSELRRFEFTKLPAEIRDMIYKLLIPEIVYFEVHDAMCPQPPSIKSTERLLASELSAPEFRAYVVAHPFEKGELKLSTHADDGDSLIGTMGLFNSCRTIKDDIIPLLGTKVVAYIDNLQLAGWLGTVFSSSFAPFLRYVHLEEKPTGTLALQRRWMRVLLARFPRLEMLKIKLDRSAKSDINGSRFTEGALRMMKFVKETAPELAQNISFRHSLRRHCCGCYSLIDNDRVNVYFSPKGMPLEFTGDEIDLEEEHRAWRGRRRGGVGDLGWGMDNWWQTVNKN